MNNFFYRFLVIILVIISISIIVWAGYDVAGIFILGIVLLFKADWINDYNLGLVKAQQKNWHVNFSAIRWYLEHERRFDEGKWGINIWKLGGILFIIMSLALFLYRLMK